MNSIILGGGNPHHTAGQPNAPELRSLPFTLTVDKQDGRRFSGTFASPRNSEQVIAVISRDGSIYLADDEGYTRGTLLAPDRMELCFLYVSVSARVASCTELTSNLDWGRPPPCGEGEICVSKFRVGGVRFDHFVVG